MEGSKEKCSVKGRSIHLDVFCKKCVLKIFAKCTRKYLCWNLFQIKLQVFWMTTSKRALDFTKNDANSYIKKEFIISSFLKSANGQFVEICWHFYQSFSCTWVFSASWFLVIVKKQLFQANCLSDFFNSCQMLTIFELQIFSDGKVNKKYLMKIIWSYPSITHQDYYNVQSKIFK